MMFWEFMRIFKIFWLGEFHVNVKRLRKEGFVRILWMAAGLWTLLMANFLKPLENRFEYLYLNFRENYEFTEY